MAEVAPKKYVRKGRQKPKGMSPRAWGYLKYFSSEQHRSREATLDRDIRDASAEFWGFRPNKIPPEPAQRDMVPEFEEGPRMTLEEIADEMNVTRTRIQQIEMKGGQRIRRKLRLQTEGARRMSPDNSYLWKPLPLVGTYLQSDSCEAFVVLDRQEGWEALERYLDLRFLASDAMAHLIEVNAPRHCLGAEHTRRLRLRLDMLPWMEDPEGKDPEDPSVEQARPHGAALSEEQND